MKVMIATDGGDAAIEASNRAIALLREEAEIILVTVVPDYEDPMETAGGIEGPALTEEQAEHEYSEHLSEGQEALRRTAVALGHEVDVRLAPAEQEPGHAIVEIAKEVKPDILVIGSSGKSLFRRLFTGSVSDHVVHHAPCPVLVVRHDQ
jgi:nucleotide-binding universal stress UspA family protein